MTTAQKGQLVLRFGLAGVFLWFGFSQLFDGLNWVAWIPEWATTLIPLPPAMIVLLNGLFEVFFASLLALGIWQKYVPFILFGHILLVVIAVGYNATGVRDFGLAMATLSFALQNKDEYNAKNLNKNYKKFNNLS